LAGQRQRLVVEEQSVQPGLKGMTSDQTSPEAAYSQPIGLAGRRSASTSPMVA